MLKEDFRRRLAVAKHGAVRVHQLQHTNKQQLKDTVVMAAGCGYSKCCVTTVLEACLSRARVKIAYD